MRTSPACARPVLTGVGTRPSDNHRPDHCFVGSGPSRAVRGIYQKWFENGEMRIVFVTDLLTVRDDCAAAGGRQPQREPQLDELLG